jgi:membrane-associated phospholipid phosphatase
MQRELAEVKDTVTHLTRDQIAVAYRWTDGVSTATPPGHWNIIAWPYLQNSGFSEVRSARTLALMNMALHDAAVVTWDTKFTYFNPRPSQLDPEIRTIIGLPNFPSYISGHSTYSAAAANVLSYVFPQSASAFDALKDEAAVSRLYAAIHFRSDIDVGKVVGRRVGDYTVRFAIGDGADR